MTQYYFAGSLYRCSNDMHMACAEEWLSAGGKNDRQTMLEFLSKMTDAELTEDCWSGWNLGEHDPESNKAEFSKETLQECFADIRKDFDEHFPAKDD